MFVYEAQQKKHPTFSKNFPYFPQNPIFQAILITDHLYTKTLTVNIPLFNQWK